MRYKLLLFPLVALAACSSGEDEPRALTALSSLRQVQDRHDAGSTFSSVRGEIVTTRADDTARRSVWQEVFNTRTEYSQSGAPIDHLVVLNERNYYSVELDTRRYCRRDRDSILVVRKLPSWSIIPDIQAQSGYGSTSMDLTDGYVDSSGDVAGRSAVKVLIDVTRPGEYVWLDAIYGIVLRYEDDDADASATSLSEFTQIKFDENIDHEFFEPPPLEGYAELSCDDMEAS